MGANFTESEQQLVEDVLANPTSIIGVLRNEDTVELLQNVIDNDRVTTFQEDLDIVKEVQRGLNSRGYRPGPLVVDPAGGIDNELPIQKLHEWLRAAID